MGVGGPDHEVIVIGAGIGGICAGVRLKQAGIDDFVIVDRSDGPGGTWRQNVYPGVAVDIPSLTYQYSFAPNPNWSRVFAPGAEVLAYLESVVERYDLTSHCRFGVNIQSERWDDDAQSWVLQTADGSHLTARFVISAIGPFLNPKPDPGIVGVADFAGTVAAPADWRPEYDLRDKRVAVIGTGATGVQLAGHVAPEVDSMVVFQRTPVYCVPKPDFVVPSWLQRILALPGVFTTSRRITLAAIDVGLLFLAYTPGVLMRPAMRAFDRVVRRLYSAYLRRVVDDPATACALLPAHGLFGNRPTLNSTFPRAFNRSGVDLETTPIDRVVSEGVRTVDGQIHRVDYLVVATGFELFSEPSSYPKGRVVGRAGVDLGEYFTANGMRAYDSTAVPGFPNRWIVVGPYSWTGTGWHELVEVAVDHAVRAISIARRRSAGDMEVTPAAEERFHRRMLRRGRNLKYYFTELNRGVNSYWVNSDNDIPILRASTYSAAKRSANHFPEADYTYGECRVVAGQDGSTHRRKAVV